MAFDLCNYESAYIPFPYLPIFELLSGQIVHEIRVNVRETSDHQYVIAFVAVHSDSYLCSKGQA